MAYLLEYEDERDVIHRALNSRNARESIIVCMAFLDATLERALRRRFSDDKDLCKKVFNPASGALGPYAPKVDLGCLLGMYSEAERSAMSGLGHIRNDFAHKVVDEKTLIESASFKKHLNRLTLHNAYTNYPGLDELEIGGNPLLADENNPNHLRLVFINNYRIMQHKLVLDQFRHRPHSNEPAEPSEIIKLMDEKHGSREAWLQKREGLHLVGPQKKLA